VAENESKWLLVLLKTDGNKGSASVMCQAIDQDPMFPDKVILRGILGFFWPTGRHHLQVQAWSVPKSVVLNWMLGALRPGMPHLVSTGEPRAPRGPQTPREPRPPHGTFGAEGKGRTQVEGWSLGSSSMALPR
jgi:hypothetical protein